MDLRSLKDNLAWIRKLPFHPQWLVFKDLNKELLLTASLLKGKKRVLDIGCGRQEVLQYIPGGTEYIGLDYYETATQWYNSRPHIYGDAQTLPFQDNSMDVVLLLDVLEHLPEPDPCLKEIFRVLRPAGRCILQVPFLYPAHDRPLDFHRWTEQGLQHAAAIHGFTILQRSYKGEPVETAALLTNIALSKTVLNWVTSKNPALIFGALLPLLIPMINITAWLLVMISPKDDMMPFRYRYVLEKGK